MTGWRVGLLAMIVWAAHFFGAYGLMLVFPDAPVVGWLSLGLGLACLAALALLWRKAPRVATSRASLLLAGIAIAWQSAVALF